MRIRHGTRRAAPLDRSSASLPSGPRLHSRVFLWIGAAVIAWGTVRALHFSWVCDDAYLSFRYARNLTRGMGLVFNAGERVEGYTNFLWTLWCALGLRLGVTPETWSVVWGVACFSATLMLLCLFTRWRRRETGSFLLPVAAMLAASHRDWAIYATSGLEASLLCLLAVGGYLLLVLRPPAPARAAAAGAVLGLASLTRPDGILFAALGGLFVLWTARPRWRVALAYAIPFLVVWLPWMMWKLGYYGDVFPNTYYAKSAYLPWYEQGLVYLGLYFMKYGVLASGLVLVAWLGLVRRPPPDGSVSEARRSWNRAAALAAAFACVYTGYVARVGGDFMFARLLIPATPFFAILVELALGRVIPDRAPARAAAAVAAAAAMVVTPSPVAGDRWIRGIGDEWYFYRQADRAAERRLGLGLSEYFEGLPIRVAFTGTQAILAYYSDAPVAIEAHAGLTDATIARQPLESRGRPGHEKQASWRYLIERRRTHLYLDSSPALSDTLAAYIPVATLTLDSLTTTVLFHDPPVLRALVGRGARLRDVARRDD